VQVNLDDALAALDTGAWEVLVAEERRRTQARSGVDAVVRAVRRPERAARSRPTRRLGP
jgi:hypothetical protein